MVYERKYLAPFVTMHKFVNPDTLMIHNVDYRFLINIASRVYCVLRYALELNCKDGYKCI